MASCRAAWLIIAVLGFIPTALNASPFAMAVPLQKNAQSFFHPAKYTICDDVLRGRSASAKLILDQSKLNHSEYALLEIVAKAVVGSRGDFQSLAEIVGRTIRYRKRVSLVTIQQAQAYVSLYQNIVISLVTTGHVSESITQSRRGSLALHQIVMSLR